MGTCTACRCNMHLNQKTKQKTKMFFAHFHGMHFLHACVMLTACMHCVTVKKCVHAQLQYPLFVTLYTVLWWEIAVLLSSIVPHPLCACTVHMQEQKCLYVHMHNHNTIHLPSCRPVMTNNWVIVNYLAEWIVCTCHMQKHAHVHMHNCNSFHLRTWELFCDEKYLSYCQLLFFMNKKHEQIWDLFCYVAIFSPSSNPLPPDNLSGSYCLYLQVK